MAEMLSVISVVLFIVAAIFIIIAVVLWFVFKIPNVIGDLSGRNAKKSIRQMRVSNENKARKRNNGSLDTDNKMVHASTYFDVHMNETGLLNDNVRRNVCLAAETESLNSDTGDLMNNSEEILDGSNKSSRDEIMKRVGFVLLEEILLVHTDEVIG